MKIKTIFAVFFFTVFGTSAFAADATVSYVSGKVEVQRGNSWVALNKGDSLSKSDVISTGFQSEAKIKLMDSVLYLGPVTRITLEELSASGNQDNVNVYLKTGTVRSQVRHSENRRVDYKVHTAIAVASCRGTDWIMDDSNNIDCFDGLIAVADYNSENIISGDGVLVQADQTVSVSDASEVSAPVNTVEKAAAEITNAVATAASKESVSSGASGFDASNISAKTEGGSENTGNLIVSFDIMSDIEVGFEF